MRAQMVFTEQEGHEQVYYKEQIEPKLSDSWGEAKHIFAYETNKQVEIELRGTQKHRS